MYRILTLHVWSYGLYLYVPVRQNVLQIWVRSFVFLFFFIGENFRFVSSMSMNGDFRVRSRNCGSEFSMFSLIHVFYEQRTGPKCFWHKMLKCFNQDKPFWNSKVYIETTQLLKNLCPYSIDGMQIVFVFLMPLLHLIGVACCQVGIWQQ